MGEPRGVVGGRSLTSWTPLLAAVLFFAPAVASAQEYGQWWWEGALGATARSYRNSLQGFETTSNDERSGELSLGIDGFLGHPALGRFSLLGSAGLVDYDGTRAFGSRRWGMNANLQLLPRGRYPLTLYATRQSYSYSDVVRDDPLLFAGIPDTSLGFGGRLRLRGGALAGTLLGYDRSDTTYSGTERQSAFQETAFGDWARTLGRFDQHLRLEQQRQSFGLVDYEIRDRTASFDQRARLGEKWRWELFAYGVSRQLDYAEAVSRLDNARTSQHLMDVIGPRATLDLSYDGGLSRGAAADFQSHTALGRVQLRPRPSWTLTPYAGYGLQLANGARLGAPQAGLSASWSRARGGFDLVVNEAVGVAWLQRDSGPGDSSLSLGLGASVGHGDERRLRSEVETSWARNRLRRAGEPIEGLPDLGVGLAGVGTENDLRGRLTLRRRFGSSISVYGYGEASRRELSGIADPAVREGTAAPAIGPATVDVLNGTMQVTARRLTASANLGTSRVETTPSQEVWFWAASLTMRPFRRLALDGSYRVDHRDFVLAPGIDARRVEGTAQLDLGAFLLKAQAFETTETPAGRPERRNRGVSLSLVRRFGGWLPIVTGAPSGGTVQ